MSGRTIVPALSGGGWLAFGLGLVAVIGTAGHILGFGVSSGPQDAASPVAHSAAGFQTGVPTNPAEVAGSVRARGTENTDPRKRLDRGASAVIPGWQTSGFEGGTREPVGGGGGAGIGSGVEMPATPIGTASAPGDAYSSSWKRTLSGAKPSDTASPNPMAAAELPVPRPGAPSKFSAAPGMTWVAVPRRPYGRGAPDRPTLPAQPTRQPNWYAPHYHWHYRPFGPWIGRGP